MRIEDLLLRRMARAALLSLTLASSAVNAPALVRAQPGAATAQAREVLELTVNLGEQEVLPAQGVKSYSEGTRGIIDIRLTGDSSRFVVVGLAPGVTTLLFLMVDGSERHYRITVVDPNQVAGHRSEAGKNPLAVAPQVNIRLDLYFVQLDKSYNHTIGMNVPTTVGAGTFSYGFDIPTRTLVSNSAIVGTELLPQLELAQAQGWAKVSRHVAVITTNGTAAKFDTGGEFNVRTVQGLTAAVNAIKYGSVLGVKPRYDEDTRRIELVVGAEVADLTATTADVPGRNVSTLETVVNLGVGESLAVAGLTSKTKERQVSGLPGLSKIPILGLLFGKQNAREKDTENVVFIVPSIVEPLSRPRAKEFLNETLRRYEDYSGDGELEPLLPGFEATQPRTPTPAQATAPSPAGTNHANASTR